MPWIMPRSNQKKRLWIRKPFLLAFGSWLFLCWNYKLLYNVSTESVLMETATGERDLRMATQLTPGPVINRTAVQLLYQQNGKRWKSLLTTKEEEEDVSNAAIASPALMNFKFNATAANLFYDYHFQSMRRWIKESTALDWDARNKASNFDSFKKALDHPYVVNEKALPDLTALSNHQYFVWPDICQAAKAFQQYYPNNNTHPHVSIVRLDENWGEFSSVVSKKTAKWHGSLFRWIRAGCNQPMVMQYINHPDTRAIVTTQFQHNLNHPKVHSLPLGIKSWNDLSLLLRQLRKSPPTIGSRPQLLMINSRLRNMREQTIDTVINNFRHLQVSNTYGKRYKHYLKELRQSKFILSPGGLGFDCYRHWEAVYMGTIPILEHLNRTDGWFRSLDHLPVAWIDSYDNLTPQWLNIEYERIIGQATKYNYQKLTKQWWIDMIQSSLK